MLPAWLVPLVVQLGSKLIEEGFKAAAGKPDHKKIQIFDKIEKKDAQLAQKMRENDETH